MLLEGHQLGHYRLVRQIGSGGMGTIFLAEDTHMPRQVAVKVVRTGDDMPHSQEATQRMLRNFQREMRAIVQLDHPHILPVFDFGQETVAEATYSYLVMLYRPEGSLSDWLRQPQNTRISLTNAAEWFIQAAQALQHAHARGIVHQDVKPSNFLVRADTTHPEVLPELLLADFGIARFSSTTTTQSQSQNVRGTPMFMSPEQWDGRPVPASDQYALAIMTFRMLTGRFPFQGTMGQIMHHHYMVQPPAPSSFNSQLTAEIDQVILRALAKEPGQRFPDILAFASAFSQAVRASESLQHVLIEASTQDDQASRSLTASAIVDAGQLTGRQPASQAHLPAMPLADPASTLIKPAGSEGEKQPPASAQYFRGNNDTTFITPTRPTSLNDAPTPVALTPLGGADPTFLIPTPPANIGSVVGGPAVPPTASLSIPPLAPATQAPPTTMPNQQQARTGRRSYSPMQKGLFLALLALVILAGSGLVLSKGLVTNKGDASHGQLSLTTQTVHTPAGDVTVIVVATATGGAGQPSISSGGGGSTPVPGTGSQATAAPTSGSGSPSQQPSPTSVPPGTTPVPSTPTPTPVTPAPTPTPPPGCTISPWSLNLRSESNGGTVFYVTNYCNRTVLLRFTQTPTYTTDLQVCFGSSGCTGWNSAPSSNVGTFIEFDSGVSVGIGFTVNARCHGGGSCPSVYTVYGEAKY